MRGANRGVLLLSVIVMFLLGLVLAACGAANDGATVNGAAAGESPTVQSTSVETGVTTSAAVRSITVNGVGIESVVPDTAQASVGAVVTDSSAAAALQLVDQRLTAVVKVLRDNGIPDEKIKTVDYTVAVNYNYNDPSRQITGYTVSHMVQFSVSPAEKVGDVIGAAIEAGANQVSNVFFTTADPNAATQQARAKAVDDALARAQRLAQAANVQLGAPISISEGTLVNPIVKATAGGGQGAGSSPVETGLQQIEVDVTVTYEIK